MKRTQDMNEITEIDYESSKKQHTEESSKKQHTEIDHGSSKKTLIVSQPSHQLLHPHLPIRFQPSQQTIDEIQKLYPSYLHADPVFVAAPRSQPIYEGQWLNGLHHGFGKYIKTDGSTYEGEFVLGKCHGLGKWRWANGASHEGHFVNGKSHGYGVYRYPSGDVYEGEFAFAICHGQGSYRSIKGLHYVGSISNGVFHGKGKLSKSTSTYTGDFFNGKRHGYGHLVRHKTGDSYEGDYMNDCAHGKGIIYMKDHMVIGYFACGLPHGITRVLWYDGSEYSGTVVMGIKNGPCTEVDAAGQFYESTYFNGVRTATKCGGPFLGFEVCRKHRSHPTTRKISGDLLFAGFYKSGVHSYRPSGWVGPD